MRQVNAKHNFSGSNPDAINLANYNSQEAKATPGFKHQYGSSSYSQTLVGTAVNNSNVKSRQKSDAS